MSKENCTNCKFALRAQIADNKGQAVIGQFQYNCHRFPPSAFSVPGQAPGSFNLASAFPAVTADMVCSLHESGQGEIALLAADVPAQLDS